MWSALATAVMLALPVGAMAQAQPTTAPAAAADDRLLKLEQRMAELERRHAEDLAARDAEIARLKAATTRPVAGAAGNATDGGTAAVMDDIEKIRTDALADIEARRTPFTIRNAGATINPRIAVTSDFTYVYSSNRKNEALNRLDLREVELDIRAAVDPRADAVAIITFERDAENPVFPDEIASGPDTTIALEEGYIYLHDFGVPNLTAKVGRFLVKFGRQNQLHLHDLPLYDPPLAQQAFLAPEAYGDGGVSMSYLVPPKLVGGQAIELTAEILAGEGGASESAVFPGDLTVDSPALNLHALWNLDLGRNWNVEFGGSLLTGRRDADSSLRATLYGLDLTFIRRDPTGRFNNTFIEAELIYGDIDTPEGTQNAWGGYAMVQQQINRDWYIGMRADYTQNPNDDKSEAYGLSPYVSWYWSEFLRFRLQYSYRAGDVPTENNIYFQATWIFGAHPPHPYWTLR
jgi:hypothetical protein